MDNRDIHRLYDYMEKVVDLTDQDKKLIALHCSKRKYLKGQFIVQQGDICAHENFVVSGCTRTYYLDKEGIEHIVMFAIENWWTADLGSFITRTPAMYNVQCLVDTVVLQFSFENLEQLYHKVPKLERFFRIIIQRAFVASEKRIVSNLSLTAKERYLKFKSQYPKIEQKVPQYMIASYLGFTKEFLSKIRNEMRNELP